MNKLVIAIVFFGVTLASDAMAGWTLGCSGDADQQLSATALYYNYPNGWCGSVSSSRGQRANPFLGENLYCNSYTSVQIRRVPSGSAVGGANQEVNATVKWTWTYNPNPLEPPASAYRFEFDVQAIAVASTCVGMGGPSGFGKLVASASAELAADTANSDTMSRSTQIWVGADHRPSSFSITGFGIGKTELSMQWSLPDYSELMPSMGRSEMIRVSATDDDPGAQCFVEIWTRGLIQRQAIGYTSRNYDTSATGMAYFDDSYSNLQFYAPVLK